jgi:hypothetical protein
MTKLHDIGTYDIIAYFRDGTGARATYQPYTGITGWETANFYARDLLDNDEIVDDVVVIPHGDKLSIDLSNHIPF